MRLSQIKLAGFKSFVDPSTIQFRSNLTAILGPNGCGKSNTIDAVRWVMGESSAKHLRGQSMDDVIFNGSSARKAIGQASVELIFDNTDKSLGGSYAAFDELSIKRRVRRDGQSQYFLNNTRCRRRDITDIFLGTGLGPRSYAIIEQGMISRLIESKPAELRIFLEEAAGISKYKQRRREAETRIRHTRESLQRLADVQDEIDKQLARLKRQSNAAIKFKSYKTEERQLQAELLLLRLQQQEAKLYKHQRELDQNATQHQALLSQLRRTERELEQQRLEHENANEAFNQIQANYYRITAEISRLEQTIQHQRELYTRQANEQAQLQSELAAVLEQIEADRQDLSELSDSYNEIEPLLEQQQTELEIAQETRLEAEYEQTEWQEQWASLQAQLAEPTQQSQIENNRLLQIEQMIQQYQQHLARLKDEMSAYHLEDLQANLAQLEQRKNDLFQQKQAIQTQQKQHQIDLQTSLSTQKQLKQAINQYTAEGHRFKGRLVSLQVLQQAGLNKGSGKTHKQLNNWLHKNNLDKKVRLAECIKVDIGWEHALETVLGEQLEALYIDDIPLQRLQIPLQELAKNNLRLISSQSANSYSHAETIGQLDNTTVTLASKVQHPEAIRANVSHIYCAEDLSQAFAKQALLQVGQSIITKEGIELGLNYLRIRADQVEHQGLLLRQQEIESLQITLQQLRDNLQNDQNSLNDNQVFLKQLNQQANQYQNQFNQCHQNYSQVAAEFSSLQSQLNNSQQRIQLIDKEKQALQQSIQAEQLQHQQAQQRHDQALEQIEQLSQQKEELVPQGEILTESLAHADDQLEWLMDALQESRSQLESLGMKKQFSEQQLQRLQDNLQQLQQRQTRLLEQAKQEQQPEEDLEARLQTELARQLSSEKKLMAARSQRESSDQQIKAQEKQRLDWEQQISTQRDTLEELKLQWQESQLQEKSLLEQLAETELLRDVLEDHLNKYATIEQHQQQISQVQVRIKRLGAINLAAIEEYNEAKQRQIYFATQRADLETALETLETAMAKIDRETRSRFKDTFEQVSQRMNVMFPKLFGGGEAYLSMTDNNLLETGVVIMARPPGKKLSNIHLLSGGEKALTAVAMVFAIFELNPAPFCMLDEVDAPLDEANVGRFANLVREMSAQVQFIFITHNKSTMELAENLVGVTMREAGVSRLVSVDLEEAVRIGSD